MLRAHVKQMDPLLHNKQLNMNQLHEIFMVKWTLQEEFNALPTTQ